MNDESKNKVKAGSNDPPTHMTHDQVRGLKPGDRLRLIWYRDDQKMRKEFDGVVTVDDVSDMDICCKTAEDSYVSIMLTNPNGDGTSWPLNKAPGRGWFEFLFPDEGEEGEPR